MKFYESLLNPKKEEENKYPNLPSVLQTKLHDEDNKKSSKPNDRSSNMRESVLLKNKEEENEEGCLKKLCACTQLDYYKDFFKVTTEDVQKRIACNLLFWKDGFFEPAGQDYDL